MLINLEFTSLTELDDFVAHYGKIRGATAAPAPKVDAPKEDPKQPPKEAKAPAAPKEPKAADKPKDAPKDTPKDELSYASDIAPRVLKLAEAKGRDAAVAVLAKFGVTKAPQLEVGQYAEFIEAVDAKLAEE